MNVVLPTRMTVDEFLAWAVRQEQGRYELFDGRVVTQQPQNWGHADIAWRVANLLASAIERSGVPFYAAPMGMTVRISKKYAFEPDALVAPLPKPERMDLEIRNPVLVVEVLSRSTAKRDRTDKLTGYFKVPTVAHYLLIDPERSEIVWHRRAAGDTVQPPVVVREGSLMLEPPGIELTVAAIFPPA
jgi:Uma2 family endonuclease